MRKLDDEVAREANAIPILNDIMDHDVIGPVLRRGLAQGRIEGLQAGRLEGLAEGELILLSRQIEKKFGAITPSTRKKLTALNPSQIEAAGLRLLYAKTLNDLFAR